MSSFISSGIQCQTIGLIESPYKEKFAVPRQPGLIDIPMKLQLLSPYNKIEAVRGLAEFSHIWLIFAFHHHLDKAWSPLVRPPRLGGNKKIGVFASRATYRPNPIGMSVVKLNEITFNKQGPCLHLLGGDLVDGTPILDIKPYISYADSHPEAEGSYANSAPKAQMKVEFSQQARQDLERYCLDYPDFDLLIKQVLAQDPRPAYHSKNESDREYGVKLYQFDVRWQVINNDLNLVQRIVVINNDPADDDVSE